jgi:hypothetical protein
MANLTAINAQTYAELVTRSGADIRKIWSQMTLARARRKDVFKALAGKMKSRRAIIENYETGKGANDFIRFSISSGVGMPPVIGNAERSGKQGTIITGGFGVKLDWRHGSVAMTKKEAGLLDIDIDGKAMEVLGDWFGQLKQDEALLKFKRAATAGGNVIYANNKASVDELGTLDVLTTSLVDQSKLVLESNGAPPTMVGIDANGNEINSYLFLATHYALSNFTQSNNWTTALLNAAPRSEANLVFAGGLMPWDGTVILRHQIIDEPFCPAGSLQAPRAYLGEVINPGTNAITIKGGRNATGLSLTPQPWWFQAFENFDWPFEENQPPTPGLNQPKYLLIYNTTGNDAGKCCMYEYTTGNVGHEITITKRLGPTTSGASFQTVGDVTWNTGIWANKHTQTHPEGSLILQCNSKGQPYGWSLGMGQECLFRAHGDPTMKRVVEDQDLGRVRANGIDSVWGMECYKNLDGVYSNHVICYHSINYPGVKLPTIS